MAAAQREEMGRGEERIWRSGQNCQACCQEAETQTKRGGPAEEIIDATKKHCWAAVRAAAARAK